MQGNRDVLMVRSLERAPGTVAKKNYTLAMSQQMTAVAKIRIGHRILGT